jgi:hypothetical protein
MASTMGAMRFSSLSFLLPKTPLTRFPIIGSQIPDKKSLSSPEAG